MVCNVIIARNLELVVGKYVTMIGNRRTNCSLDTFNCSLHLRLLNSDFFQVSAASTCLLATSFKPRASLSLERPSRVPYISHASLVSVAAGARSAAEAAVGTDQAGRATIRHDRN